MSPFSRSAERERAFVSFYEAVYRGSAHSGCALRHPLEAGEITLLQRQAHVNLPLVLSLGGGLAVCDPFAIEPA